MAFVTEADAGFRLTTFTGLMTVIGKIGLTIEKIINREALQADANNTPVARPVDEIDARVTVESLDAAMGVSHTTAAANITAAFSQADGGAGSVVIGALVGSGIQHQMRRRMGGFATHQTLEMEGSALTHTPTA